MPVAIDVTTINIITILFSFLIGGVAGGAAMFLFRRAMINRQMRLAEKKASKRTVCLRRKRPWSAS